METAKIEIFKAGVYGEAKSRIWTEREVKELVDNFDPTFRTAPIILGHNDWNGEKEAYGWVESLELDDKGIVIATIEYNEELKELVDKKKYKNVSIEVVKNIEEYDLTTDRKGAYLLAVAFLGGSQPAVSGLKPIEFNLKTTKGIEFIAYNTNTKQSNINTKKDVKINTYNTEEQNMQLEQLKAELETFKAKNEELKAELETFKAKNEELKNKLLVLERDKQIDDFINEHKTNLTPILEEQYRKFAKTLNNGQLKTYTEQFKEMISNFSLEPLQKELTGEKNKKTEVEDYAKIAEEDLKKLKG